MIVILCDSYKNACEMFELFKTIAELNGVLKTSYKESNCVETTDDLRYIFIDWRFAGLMNFSYPEIIDCDEFFEGIEEYMII